MTAEILSAMQTDCGPCEPLEWTTPPKATRIDPPSNTVAVVVDLVHKQGAIRIFEKEDDTSVNIVGTEETGNRVIVPWESTWWFRVSGSLRVGYIKVKDAK